MEKICRGCGKSLNESQFHWSSCNSSGKRYLLSRCIECERIRQRSYLVKLKAVPASRSRWNAAERVRQFNFRHKPSNRPAVILTDLRRSDRKHGLLFDLDTPFIESLISQGCSYCGAQPADIKMTLDRVDGARGHTKDNVVPACVRCNYTRGPMPYNAWLVVAKGMREACELGLFKDWDGGRGRLTSVAVYPNGIGATPRT